MRVEIEHAKFVDETGDVQDRGDPLVALRAVSCSKGLPLISAGSAPSVFGLFPKYGLV
jgi:hypothetical protein